MNEATLVEYECHKCKVSKPLSSFFKDSNRKTGHCSRCKSCSIAAAREYSRRIGRHRTQKQRDLAKRSGKNTYAHRKDTLVKYALANKDHISARDAVRRAVVAGSLKKEPCHCGEQTVEAHHYKGYDKANWLTVAWLCREHHRQAHHGK